MKIKVVIRIIDKPMYVAPMLYRGPTSTHIITFHCFCFFKLLWVSVCKFQCWVQCSCPVSLTTLWR